MSIPTSELVWAGVWNNGTLYPQLQVVQSPIDSKIYVQVNILSILGGPDPSVQPSAYWVAFPVPTAGVSSLNALTGVLSLTSSDSSITITPAGATIDLVDANHFPPAYGSFSSTQTQQINPTFPVVNPLLLQYDTQDVSPVGVSLVLPSQSYVEVSTKGVYRVCVSIQMNRTSGGNSEVDMYPEVNGTPVPNSASKFNLNGTEESVLTVEWFLNLNANDQVGINLYSTDGDNEALAVVATPPVPAIPSIILTILRIA